VRSDQLQNKISLLKDEKSSGKWFHSTVRYEGQGKAFFSDPILAVEGFVIIEFDEFGSQKIVMDVENVDLSRSRDIPYIIPEFRIPSLIALLSGEKPKKHPANGAKNVAEWSYPIGGKRTNPCNKLMVATLDGIFLAEKNIGYDIHSNFNRHKGFAVQLEFHILNSVFKADDSKEEKYWVLPLMNFISSFWDHLPDLDFHPLRVIPLLMNCDLDNIKYNDIRKYFDQDNRLIIFRFMNKLGFIERLPDYHEKENMLLKGKAQCIITSVMIGETPSKIENNEFSDLKYWFPFQFLDMLGLASGTEIGAPWIELRDAKGALIRRFHVNLNNPWFSSGHKAIEESIHHGIGSLLTQSQYSLHMGNAYLTAILKHLVQSGMESLLFEDGMAHLFQALDCLCEEFGLNIQRLAEGLNDLQKNIVKFELDSLAYRIRCQSSFADNQEQKNVLTRIADKVINSDNADRNFGLAVIDLIKLFDLSDTIIIESFYQSNPRKDGKPWYGVLSHYRGVVMHSSYFDFERGLYDFRDVTTIRSHLHDILIRIVLKMLCYDGTYQKAIQGSRGRYPLDWVNPSLKAEELGYEEQPL
jgi:hypothetical protein